MSWVDVLQRALSLQREDGAFYALALGALGTAAALARQERAHRPVAVLFTGGLLADLGMRIGAALLVGEPRPFTGTARVVWTAREALFSAYPPAVMAVALLVLAGWLRGRALALPGAFWGATIVAHVFGYPWLRGDRLGVFYAVAQAIVVVGLAAISLPFEVRRRRAERAPTATELVVLWCAGAEGINLFGPYLLAKPWSTWGLARVAYGVIYVIAMGVQSVRLWRLRCGKLTG